MPMRSFSLNEHRSHAGVHGEKRNPEAYEALGGRSKAWIPNGALPREPKWPRGDSSDGGAQPVQWTGEHCHVRAEIEPRSSVQWTEREVQAEAEDAFRAWQRHVEAGRIGSDIDKGG